jgi:hypothetical protein
MKFELSIPQLPEMLSITETKLMAFTVLILAATIFVLAWRNK